MYSRSLLKLASQVDSPEYFESADEEVVLPDVVSLDKENQPNLALIGRSDKNGPREKSKLNSGKLSEEQTRDNKGLLTYSSLISAAKNPGGKDLKGG